MQASQAASSVERVAQSLYEMSRRRRVVTARVRDAKPATRAELAGLKAQVVAELDEKVEHDLHRALVSPQREDLRPDMRMEADQVQPRMFQRLLDRLASGTGLDREAELRVQLASGDVVMRIGLDAW